jgi:hypothetical protein
MNFFGGARVNLFGVALQFFFRRIHLTLACRPLPRRDGEGAEVTSGKPLKYKEKKCAADFCHILGGALHAPVCDKSLAQNKKPG